MNTIVPGRPAPGGPAPPATGEGDRGDIPAPVRPARDEHALGRWVIDVLDEVHQRLLAARAWNELRILAGMSDTELVHLAEREVHAHTPNPEVTTMADIGKPIREEPLVVPDPTPRRRDTPAPPAPAEPAKPREPVPV